MQVGFDFYERRAIPIRQRGCRVVGAAGKLEQRLIRETMKHTGGDKSLAAQLLGISTRTIYRKLGESE